ncbi:MAG: universal stress protein [Proteobacteria bacterium]|nr:universal stress protein [Pseudomonadota bacterium]
MDELKSILAVASRSATDGALLEKAVRLAVGCGAHIHLFYSDARSGGALGQEKEPAKAQQAWDERVSDDREYLDALIARLRVPGVRITSHATCDQPLNEAILREVARMQPDLVMKSPAGSHPLRLFTLDLNDWRLARKCPSALMLVHEAPWPVAPRFGALVNVSERAVARLPAEVLHACEYLSLGSGAAVDAVYCESGDDPDEVADRAASFDRLTREFHIPAGHVFTLRGDPDLQLPEFVSKKRYDVLVLGAPTHRHGLGALAGGLSSKLIDAADSDLLLVRLPVRSTGEQLAHHCEQLVGLDGFAGDADELVHG